MATTAIYHGDQPAYLIELLEDRLEFIDGKHTAEFYFYAPIDRVCPLRVGMTNIVTIRGKTLYLFVSGIEHRYGRQKTPFATYLHATAYLGDRKLFDGESPGAMWSEWMGNASEGVLVSGEIINLPDDGSPFTL